MSKGQKPFKENVYTVWVSVMTTTTSNRYIVKVASILSGEPIINGTRTPVRAIVELWRLGIPPESIVEHLPHLTQAQIFDALSYFSDHQQEIAEYIERNHVSDEKIHPLVKNS